MITLDLEYGVIDTGYSFFTIPVQSAPEFTRPGRKETSVVGTNKVICTSLLEPERIIQLPLRNAG